MKKVTLILGFGLLALTSCKKAWTCNCETTMPDGSTHTSTPLTILDQKKSDAKTLCDNLETGLNTAGPSTCELN